MKKGDKVVYEGVQTVCLGDEFYFLGKGPLVVELENFEGWINTKFLQKLNEDKVLEWNPCEFKVIRDVYWEKRGQIVKVFDKGDIVKGKVRADGAIFAESTNYASVSDQVDPECITLLTISGEPFAH